MKTRIIHTKIWDKDWINSLSKDGKLLFLYLITNSRINMCGAYEITDRIISNETGIRTRELEKAKLLLIPKVIFYQGWVYVKNALRYGGYAGDKNEVVIDREMNNLPENIKKCFIEGKCDRVSIGYQELERGTDSPINHKSEIINNKLESSVEYFLKIPDEDIKEFSEKFNIYEKGIRKKGEEMYDWCKGKGKEKQYKDFKATLRNAIRKDFGERPPEDKEQQARIRATQESAGMVSPYAKKLGEKYKIKK